jgi:hypothetical protein
MNRYQPRGRNVRFLALGMFLLALMASYLLMLRHFNVFELPSERHFGATGPVKPAGERSISSRLVSTPSTRQCRCVPISSQVYRKAKTLTPPRIGI